MIAVPPESFPIHVPDAALADLQQRLRDVRWPDALTAAGWDYGADLAYLKDIVEYWRRGFDWRAQERLLNDRLPSYRAVVNGLGVHFAHIKGQGASPFPLLLIHGWPGSYFEMYKVAGLLAAPGEHGGDPSDAFDLVIPSVPGHGFSDAPPRPGFGADQAADLFRTLMVEELGYPRFGAQGGDRGAFISASLGARHPEHVAGIHLNMPAGIPGAGPDRTPEEKRWLQDRQEWEREETGYSFIQGTKPQTLSYGLNDSPVGLAAWIVEKWRAWSDCGGDVERRFTRDELLTNVMIYWVTQTIRPSAHFYYEHRHHPPVATRSDRVEVPTGVAVFPKEMSRPPRSAVERKYQVRRWTEMPRGGHFAAMEEPELLAADVRAFFRDVR